MSKRHLYVEPLEARQMLAGNVTATIVDGELRLVGDGQPNWVDVRQVAGSDNTGRTFVVTGRMFTGEYDADGNPQIGTIPTRINGSTAPVTIFSPQDAIRATMGAGNDVVRIGTTTNTASVARLVIDQGAGRDHTVVQQVVVTGTAVPLTIRTGADSEVQAETLRLTQVVVMSQGLSIAMGAGNDRFLVDGLRVSGNAAVNLGAGSDFVSGHDFNFGDVTFNMGASAHRDVVILGDMQARNCSILLGAGNDSIDLRANTRISNRLTLNGGNGFDHLQAAESVTAQEVLKISIEDTAL